MKKALLITAIAAVSISAAACSSKKTAETTAAPVETTAAETTTEAETNEDYTSGIITAIDGDVLTVKDDYDDEERKYDISGADVTNEFPLTEGDRNPGRIQLRVLIHGQADFLAVNAHLGHIGLVPHGL